MVTHRVRLIIQDMTWEKCVSRVESTLKSIRGVLDVTATLRNETSGEASVLYDPSSVTLEYLKQAIPTASGERHSFKVISLIEEDQEK